MTRWIEIPILLALAAPGKAEVMLNEILADPAQDWDGSGAVHSRDDEWVEIVNLGATTIDLTGVRIAAADTTWRYEFDGELPAGEARVVYGSASYAWEQATGNPAYGLRLANTGGEITLWRLSEADTTLIDQATYLDEDADDDRSTGRLASDPSEWVLFDALNPYDGDPPPRSTGCPPSPGTTNECLSPATEATWSEVKSFYVDPWGADLE
jgi:hypothetical protein